MTFTTMLRSWFGACLLIICVDSTACQLPMAPRIARLDPELFILLGEVGKVVGPIAADRVRGGAAGVRVRIVENLHSPVVPGSTVDVFTFGLGAACDPVGLSRTDVLAALPPAGTRMRIVAKVTVRLPAAPPGEPMRLETGPYNPHALFAPVYADEPLRVGFDGIYDFTRPIDIARYERIDARRYNWRWYDGMLEFELHKEVIRLARARDARTRRAILTRLSRYPRPEGLDLEALRRRYDP